MICFFIFISSLVFVCPKMHLSWISFKFLPNQWLWTLTVTTIIHYPALDMSARHRYINWFSSFLIPWGALSPAIDEIQGSVWAAILTSQTARVVPAQSREGKAKERENHSYPGITGAPRICFPRQLKHCFSNFTLQWNTWLLSFIQVLQVFIGTYWNCNN